MVDSVSEKSLKRLPEKATYILRRHESESTPGDFYIMPDDGDVPWEVDLLQVYNLLHNVHTSRNATASLHMLGMVYESKDKNKPYVTYGLQQYQRVPNTRLLFQLILTCMVLKP